MTGLRNRNWSGKRILVLLAVLLVIAAAGCSTELPQNSLNPAGPEARKIDDLFWLVFWIAAVIFFLVGATFNGRRVGFQSALLELAPAAERPTYAGINAVLILPLAFLSLGAGLFLQQWSYTALFIFAALFIGVGAVVAWRWAVNFRPVAP